MAVRHPVPGGAPGLHYLNSPFGDTTYTKVFVGGLAWETHSEGLRRHFEPYGEILEAVVITDKHTGRSKGYGFVTFRDPEFARRACADPSPIIDGRRANCNLASLGRPRPPIPYARVRPAVPYGGNLPVPRGIYVGSSTNNQPLPYGYQQSYAYSTIGYTPYGQDYGYPQNMYNPYANQQYVQIYGVPGTVNAPFYPLAQLGQPLASPHGYPTVQGYTVPGQTGALPPIPAAYPTGMVTPRAGQPQFMLPGPSPHFTQGSGSDQAAG